MMKTMTLIELQSVLGERIKIAQISDDCKPCKAKDPPEVDEQEILEELESVLEGLGKAPEGYHANPLYIENKSKRLQLLTKPSAAEKLRAKAQREGRSVNDIVNTILEEALREE